MPSLNMSIAGFLRASAAFTTLRRTYAQCALRGPPAMGKQPAQNRRKQTFRK